MSELRPSQRPPAPLGKRCAAFALATGIVLLVGVVCVTAVVLTLRGLWTGELQTLKQVRFSREASPIGFWFGVCLNLCFFGATAWYLYRFAPKKLAKAYRRSFGDQSDR